MIGITTPPNRHTESSRRNRASTMEGPKTRTKGKSRAVDLGLAILSAVKVPGQRYDLWEIALFCGCTDVNIRHIEMRALRKLRAALEHRHDGEILEEIIALLTPTDRTPAKSKKTRTE